MRTYFISDSRPPERRARTAGAPASSTSPTCGSTPRAGRSPKARSEATNDPGAGATTLYFPNGQSARFLYLHDDTYGLTRLSVYAGEAAPYFIHDVVEDELVNGNEDKSAGEQGHRRAGGPGDGPFHRDTAHH